MRTLNKHCPLDRLTAFCFLWAYQALVQHLRTGGLPLWYNHNDLIGWLRLVAIFAVLLRPRSLHAFLAFLAVSILQISIQMPIASIHVTFEFLVNITLLLGIALWLSDTGKREELLKAVDSIDGREDLLNALSPYIRVSLVILYLFTVLHKLNHDFLDPAVSCATYLYDQISLRLPFDLPQGPGVMYLTIYATLAAELLIPVFFCFRRTWKAGIVLGLAFHLILSLPYPVGIKGFSSMLFVLYILFTGRDFIGRIGNWVDQLSDRFHRFTRFTNAHVGFLLLMLILTAALLVSFNAAPTLYALIFERLFWMPTTLILVFLYIRYLPGSQVPAPAQTETPRRLRLLWCIPAVIVFIGLNPYLGLRTAAAWAMFSNLRTEGRHGNHLFIPSVLSIAPYQDELVEIEAYRVNGRDRSEQLKGKLIPYFQFVVDIHSTKDDLEIVYVLDGQEFVFERRSGIVSSLSSIGDNPPWILRKLLIFRRLDSGETQTCVH